MRILTATGVVLALLLVGSGLVLAEEGNGTIPITTSSEKARTLYDQALDLVEKVKYEQARKLLEQAVSEDPKFVLGVLNLAKLVSPHSLAMEKLDRAVALLDEVQVSEGERLLVLSYQAAYRGDPAKRLDLLRQAVDKYPRDRRARTALALQLSQVGKKVEALKQMRLVVEQAPDNASGYNQLGYLLKDLDKLSESEEAFKKYTEMLPAEPNPWDSYGELLMKAGKFDESIAAYQKAIDIDPEFIFAYLGQGQVQVLKGNGLEGRKRFVEVYQVAPDDNWRYVALAAAANSYLLEGKMDQAIAEHLDALSMYEKKKAHGEMTYPLNSIAYILLFKGQSGLATMRFESAWECAEKSELPGPAKTRLERRRAFHKARVALVAGNLKTAKEDAAAFHTFAEEDKGRWEIQADHFLAGLIAVHEKKWDTAIVELAKASPDDLEAKLLIGDAYLAKGDKVKAREFWTEIVAHNEVDQEYALVRPLAEKRLADLK